MADNNKMQMVGS